MKIIRLSTFLDFGGVETRLANISHTEDANEWVFVCMNHEGRSAEIIKQNGKRVINLKTTPSIYSIGTFWKVLKILKKEKPDVIHTSGAEANFHGILGAKFAGIPMTIGEEIGIPNHSAKAKFIFSKVYNCANYVIGNSDAVLDAVHRLDKVPKEKLVKIENPIIFKELIFKHREYSSNKFFNLIMISRLEPVKNIEAVLNVMVRLVSEKISIKLTIVGTGTLEKELKRQVQHQGLEEFVDFVGFIQDPYPYLVNADLYILNSLSEGFSNSLVEAMYSKTPSLSTYVGAAPEIIKDNVNGFLIPPADEDALFEKIKFILSLSESERREIGLAGHQTIVENFSLERHIEKLMEIYKKNA